jgi:WD40 repeat protein
MALADECKELNLESVIGFNGEVPGGLQYTSCGGYVFYPLGSIIVVRNISTGKQAFLEAHTDNVSCICASKDNSYLASGQESYGTTKADVMVWDLQQTIKNCDSGVPHAGGCLVHRLKQHIGKVQAVDFSCDSKYLLTLGGQDDNDIVVWDVLGGYGICGSPAAKDSALCAKWLNNRNDRLVTSGNYHLKVWQVDVNAPKIHAMDAKMGSMQRVMQCISITADDEYAYCGTKTGEVLQFRIDRDDIQSYNDPDRIRPTMMGYTRERLSRGVKSVACVVNPATGNTNVLAGAGDGTINFVNPKLNTIAGKSTKVSGSVTSLSVSPSGMGFYAGTNLSQRYYVDFKSFNPELRGTCHYGEIYDVKFPRGCSDLFVTASSQDIRVWNCRLRQELLRIQVPNLTCNSIDMTPSGSTIVSGWSDGKIRAFYPESGKLKFVIGEAHLANVAGADGCTALCVCNDDDLSPPWRIISGGGDGRVRIWKVTNSHQSMLHSMKEHRGQVNSIVCNRDGTQAVSASADGSCIVWDTEKGLRINALFEPTIFRHVLFHPDESQYLTCGSNFKISYWDSYDGSAIRVIDGGEAEMTSLDITASGDRFASGSGDKTVKVWSYDDGLVLGIGQGHSGAIQKVAFSPDLSCIVSVGSEGGIFVWSMP